MAFSKKFKILVVCSKNRWRSPTAEKIYRGDPRVEVHSAGISQKANHQISIKDIEWAEIILCMEVDHKNYIEQIFRGAQIPEIKVANIGDEFLYMDPELIKLLKNEIESLLTV